MKITYINDWKEHVVSIHADIGIMGDSKGEVVLTGKGDTKHQAIGKALKAVAELETSIKEYRERINAL